MTLSHALPSTHTAREDTDPENERPRIELSLQPRRSQRATFYPYTRAERTTVMREISRNTCTQSRFGGTHILVYWHFGRPSEALFHTKTFIHHDMQLLTTNFSSLREGSINLCESENTLEACYYNCCMMNHGTLMIRDVSRGGEGKGGWEPGKEVKRKGYCVL